MIELGYQETESGDIEFVDVTGFIRVQLSPEEESVTEQMTPISLHDGQIVQDSPQVVAAGEVQQEEPAAVQAWFNQPSPSTMENPTTTSWLEVIVIGFFIGVAGVLIGAICAVK